MVHQSPVLQQDPVDPKTAALVETIKNVLQASPPLPNSNADFVKYHQDLFLVCFQDWGGSVKNVSLRVKDRSGQPKLDVRILSHSVGLFFAIHTRG